MNMKENFTSNVKWLGRRPIEINVCFPVVIRVMTVRNVELHMNFSDCVNDSGYRTHIVEGLASRHDARYLFNNGKEIHERILVISSHSWPLGASVVPSVSSDGGSQESCNVRRSVSALGAINSHSFSRIGGISWRGLVASTVQRLIDRR